MSAREEILNRIRGALADRPEPAAAVRDYLGPGDLTVPDRIGLFAERLLDYHAAVRRCGADEVSTVVGELLGQRGARRIVAPAGFPDSWLTGASAEVVGDDPPLSADALDSVDGVLTTCACAVALTGTIVLDAGPGQGRRALTLVPDYHLVVLRESQVVAGVPDAVAALDPTRPLTWISGPSATSDIELNRVEGVHGPRTLQVVIVSA
jgi:L-lactate dehydrogenase complex protein LldG